MASCYRMPDIGVSLDTVFHQGFDICVGTDQVYVVFYLPAIQETMVKKLREGVAYNRANNELYVWLTDDDLLKMRKSPVLVQVSVFNVFKEELFASSMERINMDPIFRKRCTYSTSFNHIVPDEVEKIIMKYWDEGDHCNQNDHDDAVDALRYAAENWLRTKHDIIGKVTDIHLTTNGLNFCVTPCNNHDTREKEKPMKLIDWDNHNKTWINSVAPACNNYNFREKEKSMKTKKDIDRIVITKNDLNEVLLRAYSGDEIVEKTIAKCNPEDVFDFNIGAKLAVDRLYDGYDMTPKPKRKLYNGKIFVRTIERELSYYWLPYCSKEKQVNHIYNVVNGKIVGSDRVKDPIYEDMTESQLTDILRKTNQGRGKMFPEFLEGFFVR